MHSYWDERVLAVRMPNDGIGKIDELELERWMDGDPDRIPKAGQWVEVKVEKSDASGSSTKVRLIGVLPTPLPQHPSQTIAIDVKYSPTAEHTWSEPSTISGEEFSAAEMRSLEQAYKEYLGRERGSETAGEGSGGSATGFEGADFRILGYLLRNILRDGASRSRYSIEDVEKAATVINGGIAEIFLRIGPPPPPQDLVEAPGSPPESPNEVGDHMGASLASTAGSFGGRWRD